jgi:hypothetical protein
MDLELKERIEAKLRAEMPASARGTSADTVERDARDMLRFLDDHWAPTEVDGQPVPGLSGADLEGDTPDRVEYLADQIVETSVALLATPQTEFPLARVQKMVGDLQAALAWLSVRDRGLAPVVAGLAEKIPTTTEAAAWIVALEHHVAAARVQEERLRRLSVFDAAILDEAPRLVAAWRAGAPRRREALEERLTALVVVLRDELRVLRAAADYVFRDHPAIALGARSERMRRQQETAARTRRANQRAAAEARAAAAEPAAPPAETPA